ncbi:MAG: hypothetical protein WBX11_11425 [Thiobacillaceae bacterium]
MSIRGTLQQSVGNVLRVASAKGMQHATNHPGHAKHPATHNATTGLEPNKYGRLDATHNATTMQQSTENDATTTQQAELTRLVRLCGDRYGFSQDEHAEVLALALAHPQDALRSYRMMVDEAPPDFVGGTQP